MSKLIDTAKLARETLLYAYHEDEAHPETLEAINALSEIIAAAEQQEPVKFKCTVIDDEHPCGIPLNQWGNLSLSKPWIGLTDEEIDTWNIVGHESLREFIRAIEAELKEKNT